MDLLVKKAWDLYRYTERFPVETIHTATIWLEEKHAKTPGEKIAMAIALHYLILALRYDPSMESAIAQEYCGRAVRWQQRLRVECSSSAGKGNGGSIKFRGVSRTLQKLLTASHLRLFRSSDSQLLLSIATDRETLLSVLNR